MLTEIYALLKAILKDLRSGKKPAPIRPEDLK